jgi:hypothetical protein
VCFQSGEQMKTKIATLMLAIVLPAVWVSRAMPQQAQPDDELPKYEVGIDLTTFTFYPSQTHPGVGGRFTYNLNRHIALESAGYFSHGNCPTCSGQLTGRITEGLFGIKAGQRFKRFGIFGKARPGFIKFDQRLFTSFPQGFSGPLFGYYRRNETHFATDLGGVVEIYPTKRLVLRFDAGVTLDRHPSQTFNYSVQDPLTGQIRPDTFTIRPYTRRLFQTIGSVGFRF